LDIYGVWLEIVNKITETINRKKSYNQGLVLREIEARA